MLKNLYAINFLNLLAKLPVFIIVLGSSILITSHAAEENNKENAPKNFIKKFCSNIIRKCSSKEKSEEPFFPQETLFIILPYLEQFTLIKADTVCHSFKKQGDLIWETKLLDLSRKLETPSQRGFNRVKTFAALESGRYTNVCLQYCGLGDMDESFSLEKCTALDLSHNNIQNIRTVCSSETLMHLQELNLSYNNLNGLEKFFKNFSTPALKKLNLSYNGLNQQTVNSIKKAYKNPGMLLILEPQIEASHYSPRTYGEPTAVAAWVIRNY